MNERVQASDVLAGNAEGFRETALGTLPESWEVIRLRDATEKTSQRDPRKKPTEMFRYIDVSSVSNETHAVEGWRELAGHEAPSRARKAVSAGDTLFATVRPYLRNIAQVPDHLDDQLCSTGFCVIRAKKGRADPGYLYFVALSAPLVSAVVAQQRGSSYPAVSDKALFATVIPLPPLPEQRAIAHVLRAVQQAREASEEVLAAARELKRSFMHRLFTYGPGREPAATNETDIGKTPQHWTVAAAGELFEIQLGKMLSKAARKGISVRPYLRNANVQWGYIDLGDINQMDFSPREMEKFMLERDDILVCEGGEIGRTAIWEAQRSEMYYQKAIHRLRPLRANILPAYFQYYMEFIFLVRKVPIAEGARSTIAHLPAARLKMIPVALPSKEEQSRVVTYLSSVDRKIAAEQDRRDALEAFFRSLLHQLMTGRLRVPVG